MKQSTIRRWGPWLALVVLFALATSFLSSWQFDRRNERVQQINQVIENYDREPVSLSEIDWANIEGISQEEWRPVRVSGEYLAEKYLLVRNRPLAGQAGFLQLVPLALSDGRILFVERGWLIASSELTTPNANPLPNSGYHELVVRLRAGEANLGKAEAQTLASIDLIEAARRIGAEDQAITSFYGRLVSETPGYEVAPLPMPKPSLNEGNHLSYAIQWVIFGIMAFIAFFWAYRNDRRVRLEEQGLISPRARKLRQADRDAEFEDANQ